MELKEQKQTDKAMLYHEASANIWERIQKDNLPINSDLVYLYFYAAINYHEMGRWDDAIKNYQKVIEDWPDFEYSCGIQAAIGWCYEALRDKEGVPKEAVNPLIEETYKAALANKTVCYSTHEVAYKLAGMMLDKGDKASAAKYYKKFLETAGPKDERLAPVKAKLVELTAEGGNN